LKRLRSPPAKRLELGANGFAGSDALGARQVVTLGVAAKEAIAGAAEALPDRIRPASFHGPDCLPLGLQPLDLGRGGLPLG
jgi:hypothetical protein